jgi:hypothetical protein
VAIDLEIIGKAKDGDVLVVDGQLPNFRTETMPAYVQTLPKAPKLEKGQRAVLSYEGNQVYWKVKEAKGVSGGQSAGISFLMVAGMIFAYHRWQKSQSSQKPPPDEDL